MENLSLTLRPDLTLRDEDLKPFWNKVSQDFHVLLWQPRKTVLPERDMVLSNALLNYREEKSESWKKTLTTKTLTPLRLLVSSQALSTHIMESEAHLDELITTRKIRIYPKNEDLYFQALHTYRRAYNLTIEAFKENKEPTSELRRFICNTIKEEAPVVYDVNLIQEAFRKAKITRNSIISKRKKKQKCGYSFMSFKYSPKYFLCFRLGFKGTIYPRSLGEVSYAETVPEEAIGKCTTIKYENGEWYACCQYKQKVQTIQRTKKRIIALDPGVRTFMTGFNDSQVKIYGENFAKEKLVPLALKINAIISERDKLFNILNKDKESVPQWIKDRLTNNTKKLNKTKARRIHLIEDLHKRVSYDLVQNYGVILLPTFETKQMVKKSDETKKRKIRKVTVKSMLDLSHYQFKLNLKWMAKKYGKVVIDVNEAYTSKTYNGKIIDIGSKKTIITKMKSGKKIYIDRDINGARNILIRFLTKSKS